MTKLKETTDSPKRGLSRSSSSPNIAQLVEEEEAERKVLPSINRTNKPPKK